MESHSAVVVCKFEFICTKTTRLYPFYNLLGYVRVPPSACFQSELL